MVLRYIAYDDIDRQLYNSCVHYAINGRTWAYKWYLDATSRRFDVLVEGEYESVMPLVWDKDWLGRKRLFMPELTPSLGIFSVHVLSPKRVKAFLEEAYGRFDRIELDLSGPGALSPELNYEVERRDRPVVAIADRNYEELASDYDSDLLRKLHLAEEANLLVHNNIKPEKAAAFIAEHYRGGQKLQHPMLRILYNAMHRGIGWANSVNDVSGEMLGVGVFVASHNRISCVMMAENARGKSLGAGSRMFDFTLRQAAGSTLLIDLPADSEQGIAGFGESRESFLRAKVQSPIFSWGKA